MTLKEQVVQKVGGLSEENLSFLLEMIDRFMQPDVMKGEPTVMTSRIGIAREQDLYDDEYDFDEINPEIAKMFGVTE